MLRIDRSRYAAELSPGREVAARMADAAAAWLHTLVRGQRATAAGAAPANDATDAERRRWFYTPTDHGGLTLHEQRPAQQRAAMRLVSTGLSTPAYLTVSTIIGLENVLDRLEGFKVVFDRERGRDPGLYYLRVFGEPGGRRPWGRRFGGHHVSLNNLLVDGELVSTTPCFLGVDPASARLLGGPSTVGSPVSKTSPAHRQVTASGVGGARRAAPAGPVRHRHRQPHPDLRGLPTSGLTPRNTGGAHSVLEPLDEYERLGGSSVVVLRIEEPRVVPRHLDASGKCQ